MAFTAVASQLTSLRREGRGLALTEFGWSPTAVRNGPYLKWLRSLGLEPPTVESDVVSAPAKNNRAGISDPKARG